MTRINLLPWREERRQELKREFFAILFVAAVLGAGLVYLAQMAIQGKIDNQLKRNQFVTEETRKLDERIKEIEELKKQRERLVERMNVIQDLQGNRPVIVKVFDQLARTIPDGVFYRSVEAKGERLLIDGMAEANNRVSNLMRNLDASEMFSSPSLSKVTAEKRDDENWSQFSLSVHRDRNAAHKEKGGEG